MHINNKTFLILYQTYKSKKNRGEIQDNILKNLNNSNDCYFKLQIEQERADHLEITLLKVSLFVYT